MMVSFLTYICVTGSQCARTLFSKIGHHIRSNGLNHDTKHHKDDPSQSLKRPCRLSSVPFWRWGRNIHGEISQYHTCWCLGSCRRPDLMEAMILAIWNENIFVFLHCLNKWYTMKLHIHVSSLKMAGEISWNLAALQVLTHWGRVTHICVIKLTIIGSDNGLRLAGAKPLSEPMLEYC